MVGIIIFADGHVSFEEFSRTRNLRLLDSRLLSRSALYFICPDKKMACCYNNSRVDYILSELREIINKANSKRQSLFEVVYRDNRHMSFVRNVRYFMSLYVNPCCCIAPARGQSVLCGFSNFFFLIISSSNQSGQYHHDSNIICSGDVFYCLGS